MWCFECLIFRLKCVSTFETMSFGRRLFAWLLGCSLWSISHASTPMFFYVRGRCRPPLCLRGLTPLRGLYLLLCSCPPSWCVVRSTCSWNDKSASILKLPSPAFPGTIWKWTALYVFVSEDISKCGCICWFADVLGWIFRFVFCLWNSFTPLVVQLQ